MEVQDLELVITDNRASPSRSNRTSATSWATTPWPTSTTTMADPTAGPTPPGAGEGAGHLRTGGETKTLTTTATFVNIVHRVLVR